MTFVENRKTAQTHIHTKEGDGIPTVEQILDKAEELEYGFIMITNHDRLGDAIRAKNLAAQRNYGFEVGVGVEITSSLNTHIIGGFFGTSFPEEPPPQLQGDLQTIDWIHQYNGLAILAHPGLCLPYHLNPGKYLAVLDGIEMLTPVHNKITGVDKWVENSYQQWIAQGIPPVRFAGADLHHLNGQWGFFNSYPEDESFEHAILNRTIRAEVYPLTLPPIPYSDYPLQVVKALILDPIQTGRYQAIGNHLFKRR